MFNLPTSTEVKKIFPKERFLSKSLQVKCDRIVYQNEITMTTVNLPTGDSIDQFCVMSVNVRDKGSVKAILNELFKIPQNIIFAVTIDEKTEYSAFYKKKLYFTDTLNVHLSGSIEKVYEDILAQIIGVTIETTLEQAVSEKEEREKLIKRLETLERKAWTEKQPRKKLEYAEEIKKIKEQVLL
jgi:hypothetical protein